MHLKLDILSLIYSSFADWLANEDKVCAEKCAACCTRNVTITGLEGENILNYIIAQGLEGHFAATLSTCTSHPRPSQTTNQFAEDCFLGRDQEPSPPVSADPCPFLNQDRLCSIYPVRPFSCRCFISRQRCTPASPAVVPEYHLSCATVISQLIEHLGQFEYWGNMLDVLPAMLDISAYRPIADLVDNRALIHRARENTLTAKPLPGFLLPPEDNTKITPLLETIFRQQVDGRSVEDIFNGK